jgi:hypothetical protein
MRQIQRSEFDADTQPLIALMNLQDSEFIELDVKQQQQLHSAIDVLRLMLQERNATDSQMLKALATEQYSEYKNSFNLVVSHLEKVQGSRPSELNEYLRLIGLGDLLTGASERVSARARVSAKGKRYNSKGETTSTSVSYKAESYYESALMYLQGLCENPRTESELQQWLDRYLNFEPEAGVLNADATGVPRLRGSKSVHCLDKTSVEWSATKSKYYRQRDSISTAVIDLLFAGSEESFNNASKNANVELSEKLRKILEKYDDDL